jgi:hypothetical protein
VYGVEGQIEKFMKTTDKIADHVGTSISSEMFTLVNKMEETKFEEPKEAVPYAR